MKRKILLILISVLITAFSHAVVNADVEIEYDVERAVSFNSDGYAEKFESPYKYRFSGSNYLQARAFLYEFLGEKSSSVCDITDLDWIKNEKWVPVSAISLSIDPATYEPLVSPTDDTGILVAAIDIDESTTSWDEGNNYMKYFKNDSASGARFHKYGKMLNVAGVTVVYFFPKSGYTSADISKIADYFDTILQWNEEISILDKPVSNDIKAFKTDSHQMITNDNISIHEKSGTQIIVFGASDGVAVSLIKPGTIDKPDYLSVEKYIKEEIIYSGILKTVKTGSCR